MKTKNSNIKFKIIELYTMHFSPIFQYESNLEVFVNTDLSEFAKISFGIS